MRRLRFVLVGLTVAVLGLLGATAVSAGTTTTYSVQYNVAVVVGIGQAVGGCGPAPCNFGTIIPGNLSTANSDALVINSNDPSGFQVSSTTSAATFTETGPAGCTPNAGNTVPSTSVQLSPAAVTGGTGGTNGTPTATYGLTVAAVNFWSVAPTTTGGSILESLGLAILAPATTKPNSANCFYQVPMTFTIVAL